MLKKITQLCFSGLLFFSSTIFSFNLLSLSDIHVGIDKKTKMALAPKRVTIKNDLDAKTFQLLLTSLKAAIKQQQFKKPDAILLLGDMVYHRLWLSEAKIKANLIFAYQNILNTFPDIPVINVFGNNDSLAGDYGPYHIPGNGMVQVTRAAGFKSPFLSTGLRCSEKRVYPCLVSSDSTLGQFDIKLSHKQHLLGLNSVLFSTQRHDVQNVTADKALNFLQSALFKAQKNNNTVLIAMHIPVGRNLYDDKFFWLKHPRERFLSLVHQYRDTIELILGAHTHKEEIKLIKHHQKIIAAEVYVPGLSTSHLNLPGAKYFYLNDDGFIDFKTLVYMNTAKGSQWQALYQFKQYYCPKQKSPTLSSCLAKVNLAKMLKYYTLGNPIPTEIRNKEAYVLPIDNS